MYGVVQLGWNVCEFRNVDLFERGYYRIKAYLELPKGVVATDIDPFDAEESDILDELGHKKYPGKPLPKSGSVVGFETQICEVKYSDDVFNVYTGMDCQVHIPCDALADIQKTLSAYAPTLHVELHFNSKDMYALRKVSKRTFKLSDFGCNHMHVAETVSFDFFYTCSVELGVASLLLGFEDKLPKIKSRKAIVFRRKRTTSEDGKPNRHGSVDGSWPVARLMPERRGPSTGLCGVMRARSGSASSYNGESTSRRSSVYQVQSIPSEGEQERIDAMPSIDFGTRLSALGGVVCDVLRDLADHLLRVKHKALADDVTHAVTIVHGAFSAAGERFALSSGQYDDFTASLERLHEDTLHITQQTWEPLKRTMFTPGVRAILLHEAVSRRVRLLEECSFVLHHPRTALATVHSARGQQLLQLATEMRASAFIQFHPSGRIQEQTMPLQARYAPVVVEYRYFPATGGAQATSNGTVEASGKQADADTSSWALGVVCEPKSNSATTDKKFKKHRSNSTVSNPKSKGGTDDIEYLILGDSSDVAVEPPTPYEEIADDVAFELPAGVSSVTGPASEHRNPQHVAEWQELVRKLGMDSMPLTDAHPPHPHVANRTARGKGHLVVCVHGLSGNQYDLRNLRLALQAVFPDMEFLMSSLNTTNTHASFASMTSVFAVEFLAAMEKHYPSRVSFIGHSLGNILIRAALARPDIQELFRLPGHGATGATGGEPMSNTPNGSSPRRHTIDSPKQRRRRIKPVLQTYISLAAPHLGAVYLNPILSAGMWVMSRWKRSASLAALALSDGGADGPTHSFLYKLSKTISLTLFHNVVLIASPQDKYVTLSSALLHASPQSAADPKLGPVYEEMLRNLLGPLEQCSSVKVSRLYLMIPPGPRSVASVIGRAAHIAALDDAVVADKLVANIVRYFV